MDGNTVYHSTFFVCFPFVATNELFVSTETTSSDMKMRVTQGDQAKDDDCTRGG